MNQSSFTSLLIYDICCESLDEGSSALAGNEVQKNAASSLDLLGLRLPAMTDGVSLLCEWEMQGTEPVPLPVCAGSTNTGWF